MKANRSVEEIKGFEELVKEVLSGIPFAVESQRTAAEKNINRLYSTYEDDLYNGELRKYCKVLKQRGAIIPSSEKEIIEKLLGGNDMRVSVPNTVKDVKVRVTNIEAVNSANNKQLNEIVDEETPVEPVVNSIESVASSEDIEKYMQNDDGDKFTIGDAINVETPVVETEPSQEIVDEEDDLINFIETNKSPVDEIIELSEESKKKAMALMEETNKAASAEPVMDFIPEENQQFSAEELETQFKEAEAARKADEEANILRLKKLEEEAAAKVQKDSIAEETVDVEEEVKPSSKTKKKSKFGWIKPAAKIVGFIGGGFLAGFATSEILGRKSSD